jgi:acyl-CoA reductase-like NAD-dependent aldehyde dehydrogenase
MKFDSDEEAVKLANDSKYGLGCAVFSGDQKRAIRIASQIHTGIAAINDFASSYMCQVSVFFELIVMGSLQILSDAGVHKPRVL